MAKYERTFRGDFLSVLNRIHEGVLDGSMSAEYEDGSNITPAGMRADASAEFKCAVRVYERYSYTGSNRVSMNVTLVGAGDRLMLSAITSGGSEAVFMKINTIGEESFLDTLIAVIEPLAKANPDVP